MDSHLIPAQDTEAEDNHLLQHLAASKPGKVWCFVPGIWHNDNVLGVAVLGEAGWEPLPRWEFASYNLAFDKAERLNKRLPYNDATCWAIVADTMARSRSKQAEQDSRRFDVTLTADSTLTDEARHGVVMAIEDLLGELRGPDGEEFSVEVQ